jgi:diacylglycerol kinase (ATP)
MENRRRQYFPRACRKREAILTGDWLAIVNPRAGGIRNSGRLAELMSALRRLTARTVLTLHSGHAAELARDSQSFDGVVAVGGDGTLFEILKGLDCRRQRIALIAAGRGNSLARDLGLMHHRSALAVIHWRQARTIDLMRVIVTTVDGAQSTHFSASTVALGYPAAVTQRARKLARLGKMSYVAAAMAIGPSCFNAQVKYGDSAPEEVCLSGFMANNTRHVANFVAFREASLIDGRFEVMEMNAGIFKQAAHNLSALSRKGIYEPYAIKQATFVQVHLRAPQNLMMDGEIVSGVIAIDIEMLHAALACNGPEVA